MHAKCKHPSELEFSGPTPHFVDEHKSANITAFNNGSVDLCVQENGQEEDNRPAHQQSEGAENRLGRRKRKSHTTLFLTFWTLWPISLLRSRYLGRHETLASPEGRCVNNGCEGN